MIVQSSSVDSNATELSFTIAKTELKESIKIMKAIQKDIGFKKVLTDSDVAKISVIGIGMKTQSGVAQKMFDTLAEKSINLKVISTSEIKISVLIDASYMELAARSLHSAFGLDKELNI
jgi:aspartate kinase